MIISAVVAFSLNRGIGKQGNLLWHMPADMKRFRDITTGHHVLMGRKTYESIPLKFRPLKDRVNLVVSRSPNVILEGAIVFSEMESAIEFAKKSGESELMVIGGGEIYNQCFDKYDRIYSTVVETEFMDADAFFPPIDKNDWNLVSEEIYPKDDKHKFSYRFQTWERAITRLSVES